ncbi:MAG: hypothetical protein WBX27_09420 [Specibacter sp.]
MSERANRPGRLDRRGRLAFAAVSLLSAATFAALLLLQWHPGDRDRTGTYVLGFIVFTLAFAGFGTAALRPRPASSGMPGAAVGPESRTGVRRPGLLAVAVGTYWILAAGLWTAAAADVNLRFWMDPVFLAVPLTWLPLSAVVAYHSSHKRPGPHQVPGFPI